MSACPKCGAAKWTIGNNTLGPITRFRCGSFFYSSGRVDQSLACTHAAGRRQGHLEALRMVRERVREAEDDFDTAANMLVTLACSSARRRLARMRRQG